MNAFRWVGAATILATGWISAAVIGAGCGGVCDYDGEESQNQVTVVWSITATDGTVLSQGCAVAHAVPGAYGTGVPDSPTVPSYADVIRVSAAVGQTIVVTVDDRVTRLRYHGLCLGDHPAPDLTDSSLFCNMPSASANYERISGSGIINSCETATGTPEPAEIVSLKQGDVSAGFPDIITLRVTGTGMFHLVAHKPTGVASPLCETSPSPTVGTFPLLTILPG